MSKLDEIRALRERKYEERQRRREPQTKRVPKIEVKAKARAKK